MSAKRNTPRMCPRCETALARDPYGYGQSKKSALCDECFMHQRFKNNHNQQPVVPVGRGRNIRPLRRI